MKLDNLISPKYEQRSCKEDVCLGCKVLEDCEDAIKLTRNLLRKRLHGDYTHQEFMDKLDDTFGKKKPRTHKHYEDILGKKMKFFTDTYDLTEEARSRAIEKMTPTELDEWTLMHKELIYHGWYLPYVENNKLKFKTIHENKVQSEIDYYFPKEV